MSWGWVNDDSSLKTLLMKCIQWFVCKRKNEMEREKECVKGGRERKSMCICKGWNGVLWSWLKEKDAGWWGFMWCVLGTSEVRAQRCFHSNSSASTHHNCADDVMSGSQCSCVFRSVFNNIIYSYTSGRFFFFFLPKRDYKGMIQPKTDHYFTTVHDLVMVMYWHYTIKHQDNIHQTGSGGLLTDLIGNLKDSHSAARWTSPPHQRSKTEPFSIQKKRNKGHFSISVVKSS